MDGTSNRSFADDILQVNFKLQKNSELMCAVLGNLICPFLPVKS